MTAGKQEEEEKGGAGKDQQAGGGGQSQSKDPKLVSSTPENKAGAVNPSAPGETGTTPGSNNK